MENPPAFLIIVIFLYLIPLCLASINTSNPIGFSLKLIPWDSPESPFYPGNLTQHEKFQRMIEFSNARANYIGMVSSVNATMEPDADGYHLQMYKHGSFFCAQLYIGTPKFSQMLIVDTGSSLIWTQCVPCRPCFVQIDPPFNPKYSRTYTKLPCSHNLCHLYKCARGECVYDLPYLGGAVTRGVASMETFTFLSGNRQVPLNNMVFGCSTDNKNFVFHTNRISGILGMGLSPDSLVYQLGNRIKYRFSYCLPPLNSPTIFSNVLSFGTDIVIRPQSHLQRTPFVKVLDLPYYYLNLVDISVAGKRLMFSPGTFAIKQDGQGGCVLDSGAAYTFLDSKPYAGVTTAFGVYYKNFNLERYHSASEDLSFCYKNKVGFNQFAGMTFHFQGADLEVKPQHMIVQKDGYFCVALMENPRGVNIIGLWQQQNVRFIFYLLSQQIQFAPEDCSSHRAS